MDQVQPCNLVHVTITLLCDHKHNGLQVLEVLHQRKFEFLLKPSFVF